jgi:hypothetical protein
MTSSLVSNQVIAALLSLSLFLLLWIIDHFGWMLPDPFDALVVNLSLLVHFTPLRRARFSCPMPAFSSAWRCSPCSSACALWQDAENVSHVPAVGPFTA